MTDDPNPPTDDEANDAKPPEPDLPQHEDADSVKNHEVPTDDDD